MFIICAVINAKSYTAPLFWYKVKSHFFSLSYKSTINLFHVNLLDTNMIYVSSWLLNKFTLQKKIGLPINDNED